jgi:acyl dehydratase
MKTPIGVGDRLPDLSRQLGPAELAAYAGATWDWHRNHYDSQFAQSRGLRAPIVDGQMLGALLAIHARSPLGSAARVKRMAFRHRGIVVSGETVRVKGVIAAVQRGQGVRSLLVEQEIVVGDRTVLAPASTLVEIPEVGDAW